MMRRLGCLLILVSMTACTNRLTVPTPPDRGEAPMTFPEAKATVEQVFSTQRQLYGAPGYSYFIRTVGNVRVTPEAFELTYRTADDRPDIPLHCDSKLLDPMVEDTPPNGNTRYRVQAGPQCGIQVFLGKITAVRTLTDAYYTLKHTALGDMPAPPESDSDKAAFEKVVADHRAQSVKPELPENARRYKVQAETAVREKRYDDAIDLFNKALHIAPWWTEGHYNRALLLGDSGRKAEAVREMKKYLALEPHAPDARAAQDKIYEWGG